MCTCSFGNKDKGNWAIVCTCSFGNKDKGNWAIVFLIRNIFIHDDRIEITCKNQSIYQIRVVLKITFKRF